MNLLIWQTQKKLLFQSLQDLTCQIFVAAGGGVGVVGHQGVGGRGKSHVVLLGQLLHRAVQGAEVLDKGVGRSRQQGNGIVVAHQNDLGVGVQGLQLLEQGLKVGQGRGLALGADVGNAAAQQLEQGLALLSPYVTVEAAAVPEALYAQVRTETSLPLIPITTHISVPEAGLE